MNDRDSLTTLLECSDITLRFGGVTAISNVSFDVKDEELFAIIGPNGAGKTSIFNTISQVYRPQEGDIQVRRASRSWAHRPDYVAELGIARTFQNIELFAQMNVIDNLLTGRHIRMKSKLARRCASGSAQRRSEEMENRRRVEDIIDFLEIEQWRKHPGRAAAVRLPEARRARTSPGDGAQAAAARRAGRRHEPRRNRGHGALHPRHPERARHRR